MLKHFLWNIFHAGLSKEFVSILLSITGAVEIPLRIGNGFIADRKYVSASTHVGICMLVAGVAALLCATISGTAGNYFVFYFFFVFYSSNHSDATLKVTFFKQSILYKSVF